MVSNHAPYCGHTCTATINLLVASVGAGSAGRLNYAASRLDAVVNAIGDMVSSTNVEYPDYYATKCGLQQLKAHDFPARTEESALAACEEGDRRA